MKLQIISLLVIFFLLFGCEDKERVTKLENECRKRTEQIRTIEVKIAEINDELESYRVYPEIVEFEANYDLGGENENH